MPELMISPQPAKAPSGTGAANALSQTDAGSRSGESAKAENGAESPFAAVLKSRMDKQAAADAGKVASSSATADSTDAETLIASTDLSALLPLLGANPAGMKDVGTIPAAAVETATDSGEDVLSALQPAVEQAPTLVLAALPSSGTVAANDMIPRKQGAEAQDESLAAAGAAKSEATGSTPGKMVPEAAITADVDPKSAENSVAERPSGDFHALMERAAAMTPTATSAASAAASSPNLRIDTPLGQAGWHDEMGQKLTWMVGSKSQQADIVLTPPQLGRVEISLTMNGDQATAIFTSPNAAVREVLENSLHRLREVLAEAGVSLGQAQVGSESPNQSSRKNEPDFGMNEGVRYASTIPLQGVETVARTRVGRSMIDIFA
ncbi:MAG: hypothetical protein A3H93_12540 [Rhodocyclales bacterium RIFCSPLOWO2_02_FULL_63_24]|nr:MAG: hypothetical protein A3H93_12540 [Rhodocyclales bacterium RIFCSPLOWO2_02_FULL_63_24]